MSLPTFPDIPEGFTFENSIFQILTSIAMEEIGLSHILNAEGEKLQYILGTLPGTQPPNPTIEEILETNQSVQDLLKAVSFNQMFLSAKMSDALKAYIQYKREWDSNKDKDDDSDDGGGDDGGDIPPPVDNPPETIDGRTLSPCQTGDTADWVEIAVSGAFSLIVRSEFINVYPVGYQGDPSWQYTDFGSTNVYKNSKLRDRINAWFNGTATGNADNLPSGAGLRNFTIQNDAANVIGTGSSNLDGLENGFSKPTGVHIPSGSDDVAFALSFTEAANFISKTYSVSGNGDSAGSNPTAGINFSKINIPQRITGVYGMWLRNPGVNSSIQTAGALTDKGYAYQFHLSPNKAPDYGLVYPALWVNSAIFNVEC